MFPRGRRGFQRGQSLTEFAIAAPVAVLLLLGALDLTNLASDLVVAQNSARQGARLASILGGQQCTTTPLTERQVDDSIDTDVKAVYSRINYGTVTAVYIYKADAANGVFNAGTNEYVRYDGNGNFVSSSFPLSDRSQTVPNEQSIGVEVDWAFKPPTGVGSPTINLKNYAVFKAEAVPPGC